MTLTQQSHFHKFYLTDHPCAKWLVCHVTHCRIANKCPLVGLRFCILYNRIFLHCKREWESSSYTDKEQTSRYIKNKKSKCRIMDHILAFRIKKGWEGGVGECVHVFASMYLDYLWKDRQATGNKFVYWEYQRRGRWKLLE